MASVSFTANATSTGASPVTYSTQSIGSGGGGRTIYLGVMVRRTGGPISITSVTCNTIAMTSVVQIEATSPANGNARSAWFSISAASLPDPNATTANFVITTDNTLARSSIDVAMTADAVTGSTTASAKIDTAPASPQTLTLSLNTPSNGFVLGLAEATDSGGAAGSWAWSGLTEATDRAVGSTTISAASASSISAETPRAITATVTVGANVIAASGVTASFAPVATSISGLGLLGVGA